MAEYERSWVVACRFQAFEIDVKFRQRACVFNWPSYLICCCDQGVSGRHDLFPGEMFIHNGITRGFGSLD